MLSSFLTQPTALGGIRKQTKMPSAMSTCSLLGKKQHSKSQASCTLMSFYHCHILWAESLTAKYNIPEPPPPTTTTVP